MEEVSILAKEIFCWKSVLSGKKESSNRLVRWDPKVPARIDNLALMGKGEAEKHGAFGSIEEAGYSGEVIDRFAVLSSKAKKLYDSGFMMFI